MEEQAMPGLCPCTAVLSSLSTEATITSFKPGFETDLTKSSLAQPSLITSRLHATSTTSSFSPPCYIMCSGYFSQVTLLPNRLKPYKAKVSLKNQCWPIQSKIHI